MKRRLLLLVAGLALTACSGEPRTSLPLAAPEGADPLVKEFVEICSRAMTEGTDARKEAVTRGWAEMPDADQMLEHGMIVLEHGNGDRQLQIVETPYPHMRVRYCMVLQLYRDEPIDVSPIGKIAGLSGKIMEIPSPDGRASRGIWSFVGPEGDVVTVNTTYTPPRIVQLNMSTAKRISAPASNN
jgi:hypothetical protein